MWAILAVISFSVALVLWLASVHHGVFLTYQTFSIIGLIALSVEHIAPGWRPGPRV